MIENMEHTQVGFREYVQRRKAKEEARLSGNGLPEYAYSKDYQLRKKLDSIPHK